MAITDEELALAGEAGRDLQAFVRKFLELRKDAERWRWYIMPGEPQQQCSRLEGEILVSAVDINMSSEQAVGAA